MVKNIIEHNEKVLPNDREMKALKEHFPSCFEGDSFDIERFKELISPKLNIQKEGYELKFIGKNYARLLISLDTTTVIVPDEENNSKEENKNSENIYISGDNIDALKHLLNSYYHKIKCIYIDPPYNTGSDGFVYNDNFTFTPQELSSKLSIDEEEARRILNLTKKGSASHSAWLMFMYPRLMIARDLLTEDGVIFVSIDDNEQANLKLLCDNVFHEKNFIAQLVWDLGTGTTAGHFTRGHEYILSYAKSINLLPNFDNAEKGKKICHGALKKISSKNPAVDIVFPKGFPCEGPDRTFTGEIGGAEKEYILSSEMKIENQKLANDTKIRAGFAMRKQVEDYISGREVFDTKGQKVLRFYFNSNGVLFYEKEKTIVNPRTVLSRLGSTKDGTKELMELFGQSVFDFPKPTSLIKHLLNLIAKEDDIILDFFSGSATTAQAVMELENGCKFIMVQMPAVLDENIPIQKAAKDFLIKESLPPTLDQIGMERIRRAARKIKVENPNTKADLGFKHYTLKEPSTLVLDKLEKFDPNAKNLFEENDILSEFGIGTVLETWLVQDGYGFTAKPETIDLAGYKGYYIGKHVYLLDKELTQDAIASLTTKIETDPSFNPETIALFGYSFTWTELEDLKINLARPKATEKNLNVNIDVRY